MLFTMVKVPSLNAEPDQTAGMRLSSNFIHFSVFCFVAQVTSPVFPLSNVKEKATNCMHCSLRLHSQIPTQPYQSLCAVCSSKILPLVCQFLQKKNTLYSYTCWFDSSNAIIDFISVGCSSTHMQIVHICLPGTSNGKTYTLYVFYYMK